MSQYEQGFFTKCAEYGVPYEVADFMYKMAAPPQNPNGHWWQINYDPPKMDRGSPKPSSPVGDPWADKMPKAQTPNKTTADPYPGPQNQKFFVSPHAEGYAVGSTTSRNGQDKRFLPSFTPIAVKEDGTVNENITDDKRLDGINGMTYRPWTVDPTAPNNEPRQPGMYRDGMRVRDRYGSYTYDYLQKQRGGLPEQNQSQSTSSGFSPEWMNEGPQAGNTQQGFDGGSISEQYEGGVRTFDENGNPVQLTPDEQRRVNQVRAIRRAMGNP